MKRFISASKVYLASARAKNFGDSLVEKAQVLFDQAGFSRAISRGDKVAIKLNMGSARNTRYLRPVFARAIVEKVKEAGGDPFLCDTTTLSNGPYLSRTTTLDYLKIATANGFTSETVGCPIIIGDGWVGDDDIRIDVDGLNLKSTFVAKAIAMADAMIVLSHSKAMYFGYGGAIKNVGAGCVSKRGKYLLHGVSSDVIEVTAEKCLGKRCEWAKVCEEGCPEGAIRIGSTLEWDREKCVPCLHCFMLCNYVVKRRRTSEKVFDNVTPVETVNLRVADGAYATIKAFKQGKIGYMNFVMDVTPDCDCLQWSNVPIVPDIGILASTDIVAIDSASIDLINEAPGMPGSLAEDKGALRAGTDKIRTVVGRDAWTAIRAAERLGMGTTRYDLVTVEPRMVRLTPDQEYLRRAYKVKHPFAELGPVRPEEFYKSP